MIKRILLIAVVAASGLFVAPPQADAGIVFRRVAPVRRVAARAVLPPYPIARRAVVGPVYRPVVRPVYRPVFYQPAPVVYGPGISVWAY